MNYLLDLLTAGSILSGLFVITSSNPIISVLFLIIVFIISACYLLILGVSFVGLTYFVVYIGAIAILFLFVVILLQIEIIDINYTFSNSLPLGFIISILFIFEFISIIPSFSIEWVQYYFTQITAFYLNLDQSFNYILVNLSNSGIIIDSNFTTFSQIQSLGQSIFSHNSLNLFIASIILLIAILGPILICKNSSKVYI